MKLLRLMIVAFVGVALSVDSRGQDLKVSSHGLDVHYHVLGQGAPVLVIGGGPGDVADRYTTLCELLARNAQCVLIEQRGTGRSTPPVKDASTISVASTLDDFEAVRRQLGLQQWSVLGFSYPGYLASVYAHFVPSSVSSLLLLGSMGLDWESLPQFEDNVTSKLWASDLQLVEYWSDPQRMKADPRQANTEIIRARTPGYFFDRKKSLLVSQPMKPSDFDFEMGDWIIRDILKRGLDLAKAEVAFGGSVLVLTGRQDPSGESVPLALSHYYKTSRLVFVEKAGHYSWVEQPEKVLGVIVEFLSATRG